MKEYFKVRGYVPGGLVQNGKNESLDLRALPPFLRTLMITDGTVTKSLEAFFWEQIIVDTLSQEEVTVAADHEWLNIKKGDKALQREVRLKGEDSGKVYVYARSLIRLEILPDHLRESLLNGKIGIGELLRECGLETYREILDMGCEVDESMVSVFCTEHCGDLSYRTYRIMANHQPAILITEYFLNSLFAD
jgi:chorismate-pyruvate lyase